MAFLDKADKVVRWTGYVGGAILGLRLLIGLGGIRKNGVFVSWLYEKTQLVVRYFQPFTKDWVMDDGTVFENGKTIFETGTFLAACAVLAGFYLLAGLVRRIMGRLPD